MSAKGHQVAQIRVSYHSLAARI